MWMSFCKKILVLFPTNFSSLSSSSPSSTRTKSDGRLLRHSLARPRPLPSRAASSLSNPMLMSHPQRVAPPSVNPNHTVKNRSSPIAPPPLTRSPPSPTLIGHGAVPPSIGPSCHPDTSNRGAAPPSAEEPHAPSSAAEERERPGNGGGGRRTRRRPCAGEQELVQGAGEQELVQGAGTDRAGADCGLGLIAGLDCIDLRMSRAFPVKCCVVQNISPPHHLIRDGVHLLRAI
jgi:hypothetical protein